MSITSTLAGLLRTKAKGTTAAGALTSKPVDANTQSLHVSVADSLPTGTNTIGAVTLTDGSKSLALGNQISSVSLPVVMASDQFLVNDVSTSKDLLTQLLIEMRVMTSVSAKC